ncbi:MAG TPA: class I SAM-dependent methyltransferase, partial [Terriglobales bacterium]|nr:class I SAM-dependent methyltransferase [Terriglobales bacterium]
SPASVVGVDASPGQIAFASEQNARTELTFTVANALALPFEDECFGVAVCCLGLNFIPQPEQALREMRRVTRRGGTVAAYVWDYAQGARFLREFWDAATAVDPEAAAFDQARRFPLCAPDALRKIFETVKLESVVLTSLNVVTRFASFDDYWQPFSNGQGSAPNYLATRDDRTRSAIRERLRTSLRPDTDGAIALPARAWAVRAQRP